MQNKLIINNPSLTLTNDVLLGGVNYTQTVNTGTDLSVGDVCSAEISFTTKISSITENSIITYQVKQKADASFRQTGVFYVDSVDKQRTTYTITAHDVISKLDVDISSYLQSLSPSVTLFNLFKGIIDYLGRNRYNQSSLPQNSSVVVNPQNLIGSGITARQALSYIAAMSGGYIQATTDGKIACVQLGTLSQSPALTANQYCNLTIADRPAPAVTKVTVSNNSGDFSYGSGGVVLELGSNPLFNGLSTSTINSALAAIYTQVHGYGSYYAADFKLYEDLGLNAGGICTVDGKRIIIFRKSMSAGGCSYTSTGDPKRQQLLNNSS